MKIAKFRPLSGFCGSWCLATFLISSVMSLVVLTDSLGAAETDAWYFIAVAVIALFANILFVVCSLCKWNQFVYIYNDAIVQKQWRKTIKIPYSEVTGVKLKFQSKTLPRIVIYSPTAKISLELSKKEVFFQNCPDNKLKENVKYLLKKHGIRP